MMNIATKQTVTNHRVRLECEKYIVQEVTEIGIDKLWTDTQYKYDNLEDAIDKAIELESKK